MEVKIYKQKEIPNIVDQAVKFYYKFFEFKNIKTAFLNSQLMALAYENEEILGMARTIGDGVRFTLIVGLVVDPKHRKKGIGTKLVRALVENAGTFHINLTTDPTNPSLPEFYKKCGFEFCEGEHVFEWPKGI